MLDSSFTYHITGAAGWIAGIRTAKLAQPYRWPMSGDVEDLEIPSSANVGYVSGINESGQAVGWDGFLDESDRGETNAVF